MERSGHDAVVLIADDDEGIGLALTLIVEDAGYTAVYVPNGRRALEMTRQQLPQLIITDLMMPHLSGAQLIEQVRADAANAGLPPIPIILMTAASDRYAEKANADAVLAKPFDIRVVERLLARFLEADAQTGAR